MKKTGLQVFALQVSIVVLLSTTLFCVVGLPEFKTVYASPYTDIDVNTAYNMIENSTLGCCGFTLDFVILDVRTQSEYDGGHLYGAVLIPHTELEARIDELTGHENHEIIVYCRTGRRSVIASEILDSHNFTKVYNMLGGIQAWQSSGYPITNPMGTKATFWTPLIPAFELGLWNAWILMLPFLLLWLSFMFLNKEKMESPAWERIDKKMKKSSITVQLTWFGALIYSVFLSLKLETALLWIGLFIYMMGFIFLTLAVLVFTATPKDRPVTKGIYRISRNPMNLGGFMIFIGVGIACVSWIFLISAVVFILLMRKFVVYEEAICIGKYGDAYVEYRNKTPKWIGIPKSDKND